MAWQKIKIFDREGVSFVSFPPSYGVPECGCPSVERKEKS